MILIKKGKEKAKIIAKNSKEYYEGIKGNNEFVDGYLVNKKVLDELKEKLSYEDYLSNPEEYENIIKEKYKNVDKLEINSYEKIKFTTCKEMLNNLKDKKEYVILNYTIWTSIKDDNSVEKKIKYKVDNNQLIIKLNDAETVYFKNNSNIINESSYIKVENSNEEKIEKTFDCLKKYYEFKQSLIYSLLGLSSKFSICSSSFSS